MRAQDRTADEVIAIVASANQGVVTRVQMSAAGVTKAETERRIRSGALLREYRGVYRAGHRAPSVEARYMAAVRACGDGALLSGRAAAFLYGLIKGTQPAPEVTTPTQRRVPGLTTRRCRALTKRDATKVRAIPVTTVPRTLVDLAAELSAEALARACHEAGVRHGTTPRQVEAVLARRPNAPGASKLRAVMSGDVKATIGKMERRFPALLREQRLPLPEMNRPADGRRVDARWPKERLTVELNGYVYHRSRHAWAQDIQREREARARGDEFRRYTWADVVEDPAHMLAELRTLLLRA